MGRGFLPLVQVFNTEQNQVWQSDINRAILASNAVSATKDNNFYCDLNIYCYPFTRSSIGIKEAYLPAALGINGKPYFFIHIGTNGSLRINCNGSDLLSDGAASITLGNGEKVILRSNGISTWLIESQ